MKRSAVLGLVAAVGVVSMVVAGQAPAPQGPKVVDMQKVKNNLYVFTSSSPGDRALFSGGNVAALVTDTGVVLVDTKLAGWGQTLLDKIKTVTDKPVTTLVNTHTHGDHTGNNDFFGGPGVESITHENTAANMAKMDAFKGDKAKFLPKKTFKDKMSIGTGDNRLDLYYFGAGHTSGDAWIVYPALRVVHMGDLFAWKDAPFCDRNNGGSCVSWPDTLSKGLAGLKNVDTVIGGHLPVSTWKDLEEYQRYTKDLLAATQAAMKAGKSVDDAAASLDLTDKYTGYQSTRLKAAVQAIYDELKK